MYLTQELGTSHDGWQVNDRFDSHLTPELEKLVLEALKHLDMDNREFLVIEYDFSHEIGQTV